jgi:ABC transporter DrrB family efflux protein
MSAAGVPVPSAPASAGGLRTALADGAVLTKRALLHTWRVPELMMFATIQPIMFVLLFAYVFGGAITVPGSNYREFLIAGIFAQTVAFGGAATGVGLAEDLHRGLVDRFRSLPMARSAVLVGRTTADLVRNAFVVLVMALCGLIVGWRVHEGLLKAAAGFGLLLLFAFAMSWVGALIGLAVPNPETANTAGFIWLFPVTFLSNAFVPTGTLAGWLQPVAEWNPISATVQACRELFGNLPQAPPGQELPANVRQVIGAESFPMQHSVLVSLFWSLLILVICVPAAVRRYRSATAR